MAMNEFVKRVSDAILSTPNASDYPELVAKNAIKAMRDTTSEMRTAFFKADDAVQNGARVFSPDFQWQAMIDAAIK